MGGKGSGTTPGLMAGVSPDRWAEIRTLLRDPTHTETTFLKLAFEQDEISIVRLHLDNPRAGEFGSFLEDIPRGFDCDSLRDYLRQRHGEGLYVLAPTVNGRIVTTRRVPIGNLDIAAPRGSGPRPDTEPPDDEKDLNRFWRRRVLRREMAAVDAQEAAGERAREVEPMKMAVEAVTMSFGVMKDALTMKAATPDPSAPIVDFLKAQLAYTQARLDKLEDQARDPATGVKGSLSEVLSLTETAGRVATMLGYVKPEGGAGAETVWTPQGVATVLEVAAPMLREGVALVREAMGVKAAGRLASGGSPPPTVVEGQGTVVPLERTGMVLSDEDKEQVDVGIGALKSKDYETVLWILTNYFVKSDGKGGTAPILDLNPHVSVHAYIPMLKKFDPRFGDLRAEFAAFLDWLRDQEASEGKEV